MTLNTLTNAEMLRYSRHMALENFGLEEQKSLKKAKVLVIGCGGLGCPLLLYLTAAGVGTIGILDFDIVDESNLQRQVLYGQEDIGKLKVDVAALRLKELNPFVNVIKYPIKIDSENALEIISKYDIIADGTDNFPTRYLVNDACVLVDKLNVYASVSQFEGQISVFNYINDQGERGVNYRDVFPVPPAPNVIPNCAEGGVLGVLPGIIGTMQANEVIKLITGIGEPMLGRLFIIDINTLMTRKIKLKKNILTKITHLIDYDEFCASNINNKSKQSMKELTVTELKQWIDDGKDYQLIDVREQHEFDFCNLSGELVPLSAVMEKHEVISKDKPVVVHCRSGARSANAIIALEQMHGYDNLYNLKGGILAWSREIDPSIPQY